MHSCLLFSSYHSANFRKPSLNGAEDLKPKSRSKGVVSAYVIGTSPACMGTS